MSLPSTQKCIVAAGSDLKQKKLPFFPSSQMKCIGAADAAAAQKELALLQDTPMNMNRNNHVGQNMSSEEVAKSEHLALPDVSADKNRKNQCHEETASPKQKTSLLKRAKRIRSIMLDDAFIDDSVALSVKVDLQQRNPLAANRSLFVVRSAAHLLDRVIQADPRAGCRTARLNPEAAAVDGRSSSADARSHTCADRPAARWSSAGSGGRCLSGLALPRSSPKLSDGA
ncbi:hypothetical protein PR202_gb22742 [Eleusine coracana subsp. coracana]|uniref:Uncharacterized protein n=1 Tax=Eleusine coracana subsp. coracana TaxID=191504 RepID=A0AAV5FHG3_ELECO|nr:hypothetical protein PR202_gb22742 [Eleusine coracana subsp. coracana]